MFNSRDEHSYIQSHIQGTDHLTEKNFGEVVSSLPKHIPVMIYCYHGNASQTYASMFSDFRFKEVYSVDGGYEALKPVFSPAPAIRDDSSQALADFLRQFHFDPQNLNSPWDFGLTPLMRAALLGNTTLTHELLDHGVNIHLRNSDGNNALWLACVSGNSKVVDALAKAGIDLDNQNATGATALMYTASSGKHEITQQLLSLGADPHIRTDDGFLAAELAATMECLQLLRHTAR